MLFYIQQILTVYRGYILKCPADVKTMTCKYKILLKSGVMGAKGVRKMTVNKPCLIKMETFVSMFTGMTVFLAEDCQVDQQIRSRERLKA